MKNTIQRGFQYKNKPFDNQAGVAIIGAIDLAGSVTIWTLMIESTEWKITKHSE